MPEAWGIPMAAGWTRRSGPAGSGCGLAAAEMIEAGAGDREVAKVPGVADVGEPVAPVPGRGRPGGAGLQAYSTASWPRPGST